MGAGRLRPQQRLRSSRDFRRLQQQGRRRSSTYFVLLWMPRALEVGDEASRLGLTVSRRVGGAVVRNRVKRRIREWFRVQQPSAPLDLVVIARRPAASLDARSTARELNSLLEQCRVPSDGS